MLYVLCCVACYMLKLKPVLDTGKCEPDWKRFGHKCYLIRYETGTRLNFEDAQRYCKQWKDGNLVSIHNR